MQGPRPRQQQPITPWYQGRLQGYPRLNYPSSVRILAKLFLSPLSMNGCLLASWTCVKSDSKLTGKVHAVLEIRKLTTGYSIGRCITAKVKFSASSTPRIRTCDVIGIGQGASHHVEKDTLNKAVLESQLCGQASSNYMDHNACI